MIPRGPFWGRSGSSQTRANDLVPSGTHLPTSAGGICPAPSPVNSFGIRSPPPQMPHSSEPFSLNFLLFGSQPLVSRGYRILAPGPVLCIRTPPNGRNDSRMMYRNHDFSFQLCLPVAPTRGTRCIWHLTISLKSLLSIAHDGAFIERSGNKHDLRPDPFSPMGSRLAEKRAKPPTLAIASATAYIDSVRKGARGVGRRRRTAFRQHKEGFHAIQARSFSQHRSSLRCPSSRPSHGPTIQRIAPRFDRSPPSTRPDSRSRRGRSWTRRATFTSSTIAKRERSDESPRTERPRSSVISASCVRPRVASREATASRWTLRGD